MNPFVRRTCASRAVLAALTLAACAQADGTSPARSGNDSPDGTVFLTQSTRPEAVMEALYVGKVKRDPQGCLRVESEGGAVVIWPYGFRLAERDGGLYVESEEGRTIGQIGGDFRMGGGFVPAGNTAALLSEADRPRAAKCPTENYWIVGDTG
jgi:hypothetical protein